MHERDDAPRDCMARPGLRLLPGTDRGALHLRGPDNVERCGITCYRKPPLPLHGNPRGAGSDDTEDIISVARVADSASETAEIENLQHPATTADNVDSLARVEVEGTGYQQVAEIYDQPVPVSAMPWASTPHREGSARQSSK